MIESIERGRPLSELEEPQDHRPLVSLVLPAYNEAAILEQNMASVLDYAATLSQHYRWEVLVVNDGSSDETGAIADRIAARCTDVRVLHHPANFGLGQAFKTAFGQCRGDYVVTIDIDLSYSPDHIGRLLTKIRETRAKLVLASPYMSGGQISNVPPVRRFLSIWANRFLSFFSQGHLSTLTCMVRAYDGQFIRAVNLRATGMDVMPETIYKSMILRARIVQIPAHLDWSQQVAKGAQRRSSMRILRHMFATVLSGFIFRPFMFFILPGLLLLAFAAWTNSWMIVHFLDAYAAVGPDVAGDRVSAGVALAYRQYPHTFIVGLLSLMLAIQLISLGILALQSKTYFEEIFHLGSTIRREGRAPERRR